jgi:hypothetical protein
MNDKFLCNNNNNGQGNGANPAHPTSEMSHPYTKGLTKRELFAAMVMTGFAAADDLPSTLDAIANNAVKWADALLNALGGNGDE